MTPQMIAALDSGRFTATALFRFTLPTLTSRLMLGSGECVWGTDKFVGYDPAFGSVDSGDDVRESYDGEAPNTSVTIVPAKTADRSVIAAPTIQLSPVTIWLACLQEEAVTRRIITVPDPEMIFDGFIDQATINLDASRDEIEYTIVSAFDYFFEDGEGQRLNGAFHQMIWPGEKGCDNVTAVTKKIYWGANGPPIQLGNGTPGSYGGRAIGQILGRIFS